MATRVRRKQVRDKEGASEGCEGGAGRRASAQPQRLRSQTACADLLHAKIYVMLCGSRPARGVYFA
eukprot:481953-Rhodomonas_salina.2